MRILPTDFAIQRTENITKKSERREKTALQTFPNLDQCGFAGK